MTRTPFLALFVFFITFAAPAIARAGCASATTLPRETQPAVASLPGASGRRKRVIGGAIRESTFGWKTREPAWRDGQTVAQSAWRPQTSYARNIELHAIRMDGHQERRLTYHCQFGSPGAERVSGTYLDDTILTYGGGDNVNPGRGRDIVFAGAGDDRVLARDGARDVVFCGRGRDRVVADRRDVLNGCEVVKRR